MNEPKNTPPDSDLEKLRRARQTFNIKSQLVNSKVKDYEKEAARVRKG